ncbi:MAG: FAD:protein FMN transferase [Oscillospiraceae bacterium]|nr:FAD:protein FMN transferase [Oscillospiraceae bacterium]
MNSEKKSNKTVIITIVALIAVIAIFVSLLFNSDYSESYFYSMDTFVEVIGDNDVKDDAKRIFADTEKIFDNYNSESEASRLNTSGSMSVSEQMKNALSRITELNKTYGNDADVTIGEITKLWNITGEVPSVPTDDKIKSALETVGYENIKINGDTVTLENNTQLDFGCVAKGIALDYAKEEFDRQGAGKCVVSAGSSSILLYGDDTFTTCILSPDSDSILGELHTDAGFVSTSGGYHRYTVIDGAEYMHIFDTESGYPSKTDLTSVTVYCQNGLDSDFLSTMIFAGGTEKLTEYLNNEDFSIVAVDKNKNVYVSEGLDFDLTNTYYKLCEEK